MLSGIGPDVKKKHSAPFSPKVLGFTWNNNLWKNSPFQCYFSYDFSVSVSGIVSEFFNFSVLITVSVISYFLVTVKLT